MIEDIVKRLHESNTELEKLKKEIDKIIKYNNSLIFDLQNEVNEKSIKEMPVISVDEINMPQKQKASDELKSIRQLWRDTTDPALVVRKPTWKPGFCLIVRSIAGEMAHGTLYKCEKNGSAVARNEIEAEILDEESYVLLKNNEDWIKKAVFFAEKIEVNDSRRPNTNTKRDNQHSKTSIVTNKGTTHIIKTGCVVTILDCETREELELRIVESYYAMRYKTMGYKTKNYVEETLVSNADGINSISDASPLGKELLGKCEGNTVTVNTEGKPKNYIIISVV